MIKNKFRLLLGLIVWCNSMFAQVVVFDATKDKSGSNERDGQVVTNYYEDIDGNIEICMTWPSGSFNNDPALNSDRGVYKFYSGGVLSVSSTNRNILEVVLVRSEEGENEFKTNTSEEGTVSLTSDKVTWTGKTHNVQLKNSSNVVWLSEIRVTVDAFSISESKYATLYLPNSFIMPQGVTGHTVLINKGMLDYGITYNSGDAVPAKTALLIEGDAGNYVYEISNVNTNVLKNDLKGSEDGKTVSLNSFNNTSSLYKLSYKSETDKTVGFYWDVEGGKSVTVPAGRCYLCVTKDNLPESDSSAAAKGFALSDIVNEIGGGKG